MNVMMPHKRAPNNRLLRICPARIRAAVRAVSFIMLLKGIVGGSVTTLALLGAAVPEPSLSAEGAAAGIGAVLGAILAFRG